VGITFGCLLGTKESQTIVLETLLTFATAVQPCSLEEQIEHIQSKYGCHQGAPGFMNLRMTVLIPS
jgi:hypothetical protein